MESTQQTTTPSTKTALVSALVQARRLALERLKEENNGPNNRVYDAICQAMGALEVIDI